MGTLIPAGGTLVAGQGPGQLSQYYGYADGNVTTVTQAALNNLSSVYTIPAGEAVYAGAKAGVIAFTKTVAREAARREVTANVVCPGPTDTELLKAMTRTAPDSERLVAALTRAVPMRRLGRPEEVAAAVAFLACEDAGYITGQTLSVSGGLTMA